MGPGKSDPVHTAESFQRDAVRAAEFGSSLGGDENAEALPNYQIASNSEPAGRSLTKTDIEIITAQCGQLSGGSHVSGTMRARGQSAANRDKVPGSTDGGKSKGIPSRMTPLPSEV